MHRSCIHQRDFESFEHDASYFPFHEGNQSHGGVPVRTTGCSHVDSVSARDHCNGMTVGISAITFYAIQWDDSVR
jgi:hypothetical protein